MRQNETVDWLNSSPIVLIWLELKSNLSINGFVLAHIDTPAKWLEAEIQPVNGFMLARILYTWYTSEMSPLTVKGLISLVHQYAPK